MNGPEEAGKAKPEEAVKAKPEERPKSKVAVSEMAKDLYLELGYRVLLSLEGTKDKIRADFVGQHGKEFLILHLPSAPGIRDKFYKEAPLVVRYLHEGSIIGFKSVVMNFVLTPKPLLIIDYPMTLEKVDLRSDERFECSIPCTLQTKFERVEAVITDLSRGGCRINCDTAANKDCARLEKIELEDMIILKFNSGGEEEITLSGKIKNKTKDGSVHGFGVSYTKLSNDIFEKLDAFISKQLAGKKA